LPTLTYDPNNATSGSPPPSQTYLPRARVIVAGNTGDLSRTGFIFAYWNVNAEGTGKIFDPKGPLVIGTHDVTLYAQWYTTAGLATGGVTEHFAFMYDASLATTTGLEPARTNDLIAVCESDFNQMSEWFDHVPLPLQTPITVHVAREGGGAGWGGDLRLSPGLGDIVLLRYLMVSEVTEMMMKSQKKGWFAPDDTDEQSSGEGLSRFLGQQFLEINGLAFREPGYKVSYKWLDSVITPVVQGYNFGARGDWINRVQEHKKGINPATGCALLFLYYLHIQLGYSIKDIISAMVPSSDPNKSAPLSPVYNNLTGDPGKPFPFFSALLNINFPANKKSVVPGPNPDNPYPLGSWGGLGTLSGRVGDFNGDGIDEILVSSPWGIGLLQKSGDSMTTLAVAANGTRLGDWLLDTDNNRFGPVTDFDFDGQEEVLVSSPWGVGILKFENGGFTSISMTANGTDLGIGVKLNTETDQFGPVIEGDGYYSIFYKTSNGVGCLSLQELTLLHLSTNFFTYGTDLFGWKLTPLYHFGPVGNFDGAGLRNEIIVTNPSGMAILTVGDGEWSPLTTVFNGTRLDGGWLLNTMDNQFYLGGNYIWGAIGADPDATPTTPSTDTILVASSWGIGTLWFASNVWEVAPVGTSTDTLVTAWLAPTGTDLGHWILDTKVDRFGPTANRITSYPDASNYTVPDFTIVTSPKKGLGILTGPLEMKMIATTPAGHEAGGWIINPIHNHFGSTGRYEGGRGEAFVTSPWGIGILKVEPLPVPPLDNGYKLSARVVQPNGTSFGQWLLDTTRNQF